MTPLTLRLPSLSTFLLLSLSLSLHNHQRPTIADSRSLCFLEQQIGILFAKNSACNNPQSPAQLQSFAKKVEAVKDDDRKTARALADVAKKYRPGGSGDHLDVTISIHGADSEIEL